MGAWGPGQRLLACGAAVVAELRAAVSRELGFSCSAGARMCPSQSSRLCLIHVSVCASCCVTVHAAVGYSCPQMAFGSEFLYGCVHACILATYLGVACCMDVYRHCTIVPASCVPLGSELLHECVQAMHSCAHKMGVPGF